MKRLILYLVRRKLGLKKCEGFRFSNQRSKDDWYTITDSEVIKVVGGVESESSDVSLNWLLNDKCEIKKINVKYEAKSCKVI